MKKADIIDGKQNIMHVDISQQQANYLVVYCEYACTQ